MKRLSGWEPTTRYEYDDEGRLVASRPEVEWDDVEQGWMDALRWWRDEYLCPCGCGFPAEVAQDPMTEFRVQVPEPTRCHVRTALGKAREADREGKRAQPDALLYVAQVRLDPGADADEQER